MNILYWLAPLVDWERVNTLRCDLIERKIGGTASAADLTNLDGLHKLADIYVSHATDHELELNICFLDQLEKSM